MTIHQLDQPMYIDHFADLKCPKCNEPMHGGVTTEKQPGKPEMMRSVCANCGQAVGAVVKRKGDK